METEKPNKEKVEAILKLNPPVNTKELKSFLGAIQYMANFLPKFSGRTDRLQKLLKTNEAKLGNRTRRRFRKNKTDANRRHTTQKIKLI